MATATQARDINEYEDGTTTPGVSSTRHSLQGWADSEHGAYGTEEILSIRSPFVKKGDALQVSSKHMEVDMPYPFQFLKTWFVAVKRADGELYFYSVG